MESTADMRLLLIGVAVGTFAAGCVSIGAQGGAHVGPGDAPVRRVTGGIELGVYAVAERVIVNAYLGASVGPLGRRSEATSDGGLRAFAEGAGRRPGLYGRAAYSLGREDCAECPNSGPIIGRRYTIAAGLAKVRLSESTYLGGNFAAAGLGLVYTHQDQDGIGAGHFLGLELSGHAGFNFIEVFMSKPDD
jgi:hypothetical protein